MPKVIRSFRESYPEVELVLREFTIGEQELAMRDKCIHFGVVRDLAPDEEKLLEEPLMLAIPSSHPMAQRRSIVLMEIANEPFIFFRRSSPSSYGVHLTQICQEAGFTPKVVQRTGEIQTAIGLVCAGLGVTIVPKRVVTNGTPFFRKARGHDASPIMANCPVVVAIFHRAIAPNLSGHAEWKMDSADRGSIASQEEDVDLISN